MTTGLHKTESPWKRLGRPGQVIVGLGLAGLSAWLVVAWAEHRIAAEAAIKAEADAALEVRMAAARQKRTEALQAKCVTNVSALTAQAAAAIRSGAAADAEMMLKDCGDLLRDPAALETLAKARAIEAKRLEQAREQTAAAERKWKRSQGVEIGMSQQAVLESSWGKPESVNRTTTRSGSREQWVYGGRNYLYFENGVLTAIQN